MELSNLVISVDTLDISHDVFHLGTFSILFLKIFSLASISRVVEIDKKFKPIQRFLGM